MTDPYSIVFYAFLLILFGIGLYTYLTDRWAWRPALILLAFTIAGSLLYFPGANGYGVQDRLKKGIDLGGGTILTYDVKLGPRSDPDVVIPEIIDILSRRVDPQGVRNLVWKQVAGNRIEIQMSLASPEVRELRQNWLDARDALLDATIDEAELQNAFKLQGDTRERRLDALAAGDEELRRNLALAASAFDTMTQARAAYQEAQQAYAQALRDRRAMPSNAEEDQITAAQQRVDDAFAQVTDLAREKNGAEAIYDVRAAQVAQARVTPTQVDRITELSDDPPAAAPDQPSPRSEAIARLKGRNPAMGDLIDRAFDAWVAYEGKKGPLDDPADLKQMLRASGVLEFRIAATLDLEVPFDEYRARLAEKGPGAGATEPWRWFPIDDINEFYRSEPHETQAREQERQLLAEDPAAFFARPNIGGLVGDEYAGTYYLLLANTPDKAMTRESGECTILSVSRGSDQMGRPTANFTLDAVGGKLMSTITRDNVNRPLTLLLDNKVSTNPPNINQRLSRNIQISGDFSNEELAFLQRTLKAGALDAQLSDEPISEVTVTPSLGADNIRKGFEAAKDALILVATFVILYYFVGGVFTTIALFGNMLLILGVMSLLEATFTLPGIAGIVLTIGMAVDANVLIFERIREELARKVDIGTAVRLGYDKAFWTIVDANLTTMITCVVLGWQGSAEIKGFAYTLGIGILATLFTALFCTRVFIDLYLRFTHGKTLPMLPIAVPAIARALTPNFDWLKLKYLYFTVSMVVIVTGFGLAAYRGGDMLDIEFRSGTAVAFTFEDGVTMTADQVKGRLEPFATVGDLMNEPGFDPAQLTAEQRAVYEQLKPIEALAEQRYRDGVREGTLVPVHEGEPIVDWGLLDEITPLATGDTTVNESGNTLGNSFKISTLITDASAVSAVVTAAFEDVLDAHPVINFRASDVDSVRQAPIQPITVADLGDVINRPQVIADVGLYVGGAAIELDDMAPAPTLAALTERIETMRRQPIYEDLSPRRFEVVGVEQAGVDEASGEPTYRDAVVVVIDEQTNYAESPDLIFEADGLAGTEWGLIVDALQRDTALDSVSNFSSQVSSTMQQQAVSAMVLSLLAVVGYIWLRFNGIAYGLAAIFALVHDVSITLGIVAICGWVYDQGWAEAILLDDFKIDLALVAALLTIVGYSLNDTIVVFDRIRENRGRLSHATPEVINGAINQTISRTVLTSGTTLLAVATLYLFGGDGVHGFAFAMLIGVVVGTYSSIAIASPVLVLIQGGGKHAREEKDTGTGTVAISPTVAR